jgi:gliding motility-associated lipoprotein GldD
MKPLPSALALVLLAACLACNSPYVPRERGYFRIDLPRRSYVAFDSAGFPFAFEYPVYGRITRDSSLLDDNPDNPYWINIDFPEFNGRIHLSYKSIGGLSVYKVKAGDRYRDSVVRNTFDGLTGEAYRMTFKHTVKASGIRDSLFRTANGITGVQFRVAGNAATASQFFVTDTVRHFLRGALYFDATPNADSLSVVIDFLEEDMRHLLRTLRWKG